MRKLLFLPLILILSCSPETTEYPDTVPVNLTANNSSICYSTFNSTPLSSSNNIQQVFPNWIYTSILDWNFNPIIGQTSNSITSFIELREFNSNFCQTGIADQTTLVEYTFPINNILQNPSGSISLVHGTDFQQKCFEWRIVTESTGSNGCYTATQWRYHGILD